MRRLLAIWLLTALAAWVAAAQVVVRTPGAGDYTYWFDSDYPGRPPASAKQVQGPKLTVDASGGAYLAVRDDATGDIAVVPQAGFQAGRTLAAKDFSAVAELKVRLESDDKPAASADVTLKDARGTRHALLDPSGLGDVSFYAVAFGKVVLSATYNVQGATQTLPAATFALSATRTSPTPTLILSLPDGVETVDAPAGIPPPADSQAAGKPEKPTTPLSIAGRAAEMLIGLVVAAGIVYGAYYLIRKEPDAVKARLSALGVQMPGDAQGAIDPSPPQPMVPVKPAPPEKILLADSDPVPLAPLAGPAAPSAGASVAALAREGGARYELAEGSTLVGREAGLGLSFEGETTLSRKHAELTRRGEAVSVKDLGSTNGTFVNGRKIADETALRPGDSVQFGDVRFRVEA